MGSRIKEASILAVEYNYQQTDPYSSLKLEKTKLINANNYCKQIEWCNSCKSILNFRNVRIERVYWLRKLQQRPTCMFGCCLAWQVIGLV